ncbi:MAG: hypothetical protein Q8830_03455, partial [Candidatus Phytoplasma australasiaticum]|nr:hypothetical protein [Candidatus Phytoplasma australasiaticum]
MMGYSSTQKGYLLYSLSHKKFIVSRDVVFKEDIFPFRHVLNRQICTITQGNMSISAYFLKLRLLWDEFDALVPPSTYNYDNSRTYIDHLACLRLFAFLMGLNDVYAHARSQLLMASPLPSVGKAYAMIMADEGQRLAA